MELTTSIRDFFSNMTPDDIEEMNRKAEEWERERIADRHRERVKMSGIPGYYVGATLHDCPVSDPTPRDLLFVGSQGRGKTYTACAIAMMAVDDMTVRFTTFADLMLDLRGSFSGVESERSVLGRYVNCGLLVIDDFGKEKPSEYALNTLWHIIDSRKNSMKPTIVTTQYKGRRLIERLGANVDEELAMAIVSRLGAYEIVKFEGKDRRLAR